MPAQKITRELLLRRAEHNEGELSTLREITLHQFDIEKIELLDVYCRKLRIVFLQNNQSPKSLKDLEYLNLALNNISKIENLGSCESLRKLDLTVNFIDDLFCVESLIPCANLRELYLTGNPVTSKPGYREFVICTLPQLDILDGQPVSASDRIRARQTYLEIKQHAATLPVMVPPVPTDEDLAHIDQVPEEKLSDEFNNDPEERAKKEREERRKAKQASKPKRVTEDGRVLQCNEPKLEYTFEAADELVVFELHVSKFIDTSLLDVQVKPDHVRVLVKDKLVQLKVPVEVDPERVAVVRSLATGVLSVSMVVSQVDPDRNVEDVVDEWKRSKRERERELQREKELAKRKEKEDAERKLAQLRDRSVSVEVIMEKKMEKVKRAPNSAGDDDSDFDDDDAEVPPLV
ncbi:hypothetical protein BCR44DRAFT_1515027 [Catenaria anguillulae PL171]|uniref:Dynein axonemal assembly factor 11-like CS domain-containing protein n=1 Tax=Catenaria anguillulae PL171 TaxID=765915 RepID=A0A1Y2HES2_9FUNG|nr:hypothetical protein BCR44DRAFT_1515027 [Catenaria anguillulae PL171]